MTLDPRFRRAADRAWVLVNGWMLVAEIAVAFVVAWTPERYWRWSALVLTPPDIIRYYRPFNPGGRRSLKRALGRARDTWVERLPTLRTYLPGGWRPAIRLEGEEHVAAALAEGHGVILWVAPFVFHSLATKMALHAAGIPVHHLSQSRHGFGPHPWATSKLARIRTRVEDRYLASRIEFGEHARTNLQATAALRRRLLANKVVSITVNDDGARLVSMRIARFWHPVATGAPHLALSTGAHLLPVFPLRQNDGSFTVRIEPALTAPPEAQRREAIIGLVDAYSAALDPVIRKYRKQLPHRFATRRGLS